MSGPWGKAIPQAFAMSNTSKTKKITVGVVSSSFAALFVLVAALTAVVVQNQFEDNYPGSEELTSNEVFKLLPNFYFQQEKVYLTQDYFPSVTRWYSNRFGLLPFWHGQSNCVELRMKTVQIVVTKVMNVTVCDTINGRMIFDQRSVQLK